MGMLDGLQALFGEVFEDILFPGAVFKTTLVDNGKGGFTSIPTEHPVFVLVESQGEEWMSQADYSVQDSVLLILQKHLGEVRLNADDLVRTEVEGVVQKWKLKAPINQDPVRAAYIARATEVLDG